MVNQTVNETMNLFELILSFVIVAVVVFIAQLLSRQSGIDSIYFISCLSGVIYFGVQVIFQLLGKKQ